MMRRVIQHDKCNITQVTLGNKVCKTATTGSLSLRLDVIPNTGLQRLPLSIHLLRKVDRQDI